MSIHSISTSNSNTIDSYSQGKQTILPRSIYTNIHSYLSKEEQSHALLGFYPSDTQQNTILALVRKHTQSQARSQVKRDMNAIFELLSPQSPGYWEAVAQKNEIMQVIDSLEFNEEEQDFDLIRRQAFQFLLTAQIDPDKIPIQPVLVRAGEKKLLSALVETDPIRRKQLFVDSYLQHTSKSLFFIAASHMYQSKQATLYLEITRLMREQHFKDIDQTQIPIQEITENLCGNQIELARSHLSQVISSSEAVEQLLTLFNTLRNQPHLDLNNLDPPLSTIPIEHLCLLLFPLLLCNSIHATRFAEHLSSRQVCEKNTPYLFHPAYLNLSQTFSKLSQNETLNNELKCRQAIHQQNWSEVVQCMHHLNDASIKYLAPQIWKELEDNHAKLPFFKALLSQRTDPNLLYRFPSMQEEFLQLTQEQKYNFCQILIKTGHKMYFPFCLKIILSAKFSQQQAGALCQTLLENGSQEALDTIAQVRIRTSKAIRKQIESNLQDECSSPSLQETNNMLDVMLHSQDNTTLLNETPSTAIYQELVKKNISQSSIDSALRQLLTDIIFEKLFLYEKILSSESLIDDLIRYEDMTLCSEEEEVENMLQHISQHTHHTGHKLLDLVKFKLAICKQQPTPSIKSVDRADQIAEDAAQITDEDARSALKEILLIKIQDSRKDFVLSTRRWFIDQIEQRLSPAKKAPPSAEEIDAWILRNKSILLLEYRSRIKLALAIIRKDLNLDITTSEGVNTMYAAAAQITDSDAEKAIGEILREEIDYLAATNAS